MDSIATEIARRSAVLFQPPPDRTPDQWADANRKLPPGEALPGDYSSSATPYVIGPGRAAVDPRFARVFTAMFSQGGKTAGSFNVIGHRLDDDPAPVLYIGPTRNNVANVIEPKIDHMLRNCPSLWEKTIKGIHYTKTKKHIAGVSLRLAWAGSATELAADTACIVLVDEIDRMEKNIKGEGNIIELADARHNTYADGKTIGFSTPTEGNVETYVHPDTGMEHWKVAEPEQIPSAIWVLWQEGTRHEWAWPCPHCRAYFVPRFKWLRWPDDSTPAQANRTATLLCPHCDEHIQQRHKKWMNARGVYVAPGQIVDPHRDGGTQATICNADGTRTQVDFGDFLRASDSETNDATFWVSGLANFSSKKTFGALASTWIKAAHSAERERIKGVINTQFGECFKFSGEAPEWEAVARCVSTYQPDTVPEEVKFITAGVDVQKDRLVYVVRAWGDRFTSWLIRHGELWGQTDQPYVWEQLGALLDHDWEGRVITRMAIDRQYNTESVDLFCRAHKGVAIPCQGRDTLDKPFRSVYLDVDRRGKSVRYSIQLWHFDSDHTKSWVHSRVNWPKGTPGSWYLPNDPAQLHGIDEDYCRQIVAEQRMVKPSGKIAWVQRGQNHYLDAEGLAYLAARITGGIARPGAEGHARRARQVRQPHPATLPPPMAARQPLQRRARRLGR